MQLLGSLSVTSEERDILKKHNFSLCFLFFLKTFFIFYCLFILRSHLTPEYSMAWGTVHGRQTPGCTHLQTLCLMVPGCVETWVCGKKDLAF